MELWSREMQPYRDELQGIPPAGRLGLAVAVMDWTLEEMGPIHTTVVRDYLEEGMRVAHEAIRSGSDELVLSEEFLDQWNEVDDQAEEPGTTHMMSALLACADAPDGLSGEVLYGALCFCYEAVLERQETPVEGLEEESENAKCVEAISFQKARIANALGR
jgi:hypothetical protein